MRIIHAPLELFSGAQIRETRSLRKPVHVDYLVAVKSLRAVLLGYYSAALIGQPEVN